jgi:hypothetical protein
MSVGIAKAHFEKPVNHLGGTVMAGQLYLIEKKGMVDEALDNYKWYNLFGDPSMLIRTATPVAYDVKTNVAADAQSLTVKVIVKGIDGKPVANVLTSLGKSGLGNLAVGKTGTDGTSTLSVQGMTKLEPGTVLTTSGYNMETQQVTL